MCIRDSDLVKGEITIANEELDDLIIARSDGTPTYNFCVVIDDWEMKVTHVIRGDDHITSSSAQFNTEKLDWLNSHYIKTLPLDRISVAIQSYLKRHIKGPIDIDLLKKSIEIHRERANHLTTLAKDIAYVFEYQKPNPEDFAKYINDEALSLIKNFQAILFEIDLSLIHI